jgi:hypothetical protein
LGPPRPFAFVAHNHRHTVPGSQAGYILPLRSDPVCSGMFAIIVLATSRLAPDDPGPAGRFTKPTAYERSQPLESDLLASPLDS